MSARAIGNGHPSAEVSGLSQARSEHAAQIERGRVSFHVKDLCPRRGDNLNLKHTRIFEHVEIGELDFIDLIRIGTVEHVLRVEFGMACLILRVVFCMFVGMLIGVIV